MPLHSNDEREIPHGEKMRYRSFAYDRRSTDARAVEVPRSLWSQKMSRKSMKSSNYSQVEAARYPFQLCWRPLAAAEAGAAASGAAGMPVRWPRRPAAVSEAVAAGAGPDFSCAAGQKRAAKPPNRRGKVSLGGLCVCQWVCR